jgi:hypothetical protein
MLQDQERDAVVDRRDGVADAERHGLKAMRTFRDGLGTARLFGWFRHQRPIRPTAAAFNDRILRVL